MTYIRTSALALAFLIGLTVMSTSAFTTADLSRDASIDVVSDDKGIVAFTDGNSGGLVKIGSNGELTIEFSTSNGGSGVNVNSTYKLGDPANPTSEQAFNITNQDDTTHTINVSYSVSSGDATGSSNATEFQCYRDDGTHIVTISEDDSGSEFSMSAGETIIVVVVIDTTPSEITTSEDLSGSFNVTAT